MKVYEDEDTFWVIGDRHGHFLRWRGNSISGCYIPWLDPDEAERYENEGAAWAALDVDDDVRAALPDLVGPACVLKVSKRIAVTTTRRRK